MLRKSILRALREMPAAAKASESHSVLQRVWEGECWCSYGKGVVVNFEKRGTDVGMILGEEKLCKREKERIGCTLEIA